MAKVAPPSPRMIEARHYGASQTPRAVVMHGTVSPDSPGEAVSIAQWWNGPTSPDTSAHYVVDPKTTIQCVPDHRQAYHCGYNLNSIGVEMADEETGPASRWQDANSKAIIANAAALVARLCLAYDIEIKRPSVAELKAKGPHGIYGHNDSRLAFGNTTHSDPIDFPWDDFLKQVKAEAKKLQGPAKPTRLQMFHRAVNNKHRVQVWRLDRAAKAGRDVAQPISRIEAAMKRLSKVKNRGQRLNTILDEFKKNRVVRLDLLEAAQKERPGVVRGAYKDITAAVATVPNK